MSKRKEIGDCKSEETMDVVYLPHAVEARLGYATPGSAGIDLFAAVEDRVVLPAGKSAKIPTGICIALRDGLQGEVRSRSGLAAKHSVVVLNSPGTVDSDYRGEVGVLLMNFGQEDFEVRRGDRVAQLVVAEFVRVQVRPVATLDETQRGGGGFGSTGV